MKYLKTFEAFVADLPATTNTQILQNFQKDTSIENIRRIQNVSNQTKQDTISLGDAFKLYNNSGKFKVKEVKTTTIPVGHNVSDGVIIIKGVKDHILHIAVDGEVLSTDKDYSKEDSDVTRFRFNGKEYLIFLKEGSKVDLKILPLKEKQSRDERCETWKNPIEIKANIGKRQVKKYIITQSGDKDINYSVNVQDSLPSNIEYPNNHSELIKGKSCVVINVNVDIEIDDIEIESSWDNIVDGENMFKVDNKIFLYLESGAKSLTISTDLQDIEVDFGMAMSNQDLPQLKKGEIKYITLNQN